MNKRPPLNTGNEAKTDRNMSTVSAGAGLEYDDDGLPGDYAPLISHRKAKTKAEPAATRQKGRPRGMAY